MSSANVSVLAEEATNLAMDAQAIVRVAALALGRTDRPAEATEEAAQEAMESDVARALGVVDNLLDRVIRRTWDIGDAQRAEPGT